MIPIVLMAGGRGLRLHPLTEKTPKPMLRVGSRPILETIMDKCAAQGFTKFVLCVNYLAEKIEGHFGDGSSRGWNITYIHEQDFLGTAGALRFFSPMGSTFIVHNADIVADISYADLMAAHGKNGYDATTCLALHHHQVPFGVAVMDGERVVRIDEKPIECFSVAAGIYVLPPHAPRLIPEGRMDMPSLLEKMSVGGYPIEGFWADVGHWESLAKANINWSLGPTAADCVPGMAHG